MGTGFARMNASLLQFKNFDYMFQIDAHTFFSKKWDTQLINVFNKIKDEENIDEDKLILSASSGFPWTYYEENPEKVYAVVEHKKEIFEIDPLNLEENAQDLLDQGMISLKFIYDGKQGQHWEKKQINFPIVYGEEQIESGDYKESASQTAALVKKGFNPVPHFPARSIADDAQLKDILCNRILVKPHPVHDRHLFYRRSRSYLTIAQAASNYCKRFWHANVRCVVYGFAKEPPDGTD